jgi:hypothetical protein
MKLTGRQSTNVEDRRQIIANPSHSNPMAGALGRLNAEDNVNNSAELNRMGKNAKAMGKKNPLYEALKSMDKGVIQDRQARKKALKAGANPAIPIPTPRPDPNSKQPTLFRNNSKG